MRNSILLLVIIFIVSNSLDVWPIPQKITDSGEKYELCSKAEFKFESYRGFSPILTKAVKRYRDIFYLDHLQTDSQNNQNVMSGVVFDIDSLNESLNFDTDESYTLKISSTMSEIKAKTVFGILHGLETFSQIITISAGKRYVAAVTIEDYPRFKHRGFLIDSARHYLSLDAIKQHIDASAYVKFNVLHWHIVDDQSFPLISTTVPEMKRAAFDDNHVYTPEMVDEIVKYAHDRGVRVIPEIDTPGHTTCWNKSVPEITVRCPNNYYVLDPTKNETYMMLEKLFTGIVKQFPDEYVHTGGDELEYNCWEAHQHIKDWMKSRGVKTFVELQTFFERHLLLRVLAPLKRNYIVWQEVLDNGCDIPENTIVHVWEDQKWKEDLARTVKKGFKALLSSPWYLNYISYRDPWKDYYLVEPTDIQATEAEKERIIGGEGCMWGEYVDNSNLISRIWPRAAAVAERLWSNKNERNYDLAIPRMQKLVCRFHVRDIPVNPLRPSFCPTEYKVRYNPPWAD